MILNPSVEGFAVIREVSGQTRGRKRPSVLGKKRVFDSSEYVCEEMQWDDD
jgi:hypothetical protein